MNTIDSRVFEVAIGAALLSALASCGSAPTRLHTLVPDSPTTIRNDYPGPPVRIDAVHVPPAVDRVEVVEAVGPGAFKLDELDQWSAPLGKMVRQTLTADLSTRLPGRVIFPHLMKPDGALGISVDLLDFTADADGFQLQAGWTVAAAPGASAPATRPSGGTALLRIPRAGTSNTADATAQVWSALLGQLADRIAAAL